MTTLDKAKLSLKPEGNSGRMSRWRIEAKDRRCAAVHEAGHITMARHIGLLGAHASLQRIQSTNLLYEKSWIGQTRYLAPERTGTTLSSRNRVMFAVAGTVAEFCWQRISFDETEDAWYEPEVMSPTDWAGCNCEPGDPTEQLFAVIETAFSLFDRRSGKLWPEVLNEARLLIEDSRRLR